MTRDWGFIKEVTAEEGVFEEENEGEEEGGEDDEEEEH